MGSDNLFYKRKKRKADSLKRMKAKRDPYDIVLIVCEGEKTEPNYFEELRDAFKLNTANIEICGDECGSSPRNVVDHAIKKYKGSKDYDKVYCVFDKDRHLTYNEALDIVRRAKSSKGHSFFAITSVPCFEIWFLLHYRYTTKVYVAGQGSICAKVIEDLEQYFPNYEKGSKNTFQQFQDKMNTAIKNAKKLTQYNDQVGTDHPSTNVYELVEYLQELKK